MGHTDGKQQCGDFMGKRRPCCVSGHLRVTYSSISSDLVFGFPQSGFGRPQTRNSSFKNAYLQLCPLQSMLYTDIKPRFLLNVPVAEEINSQGMKGQEKTFCVF